MQQMSKVIGNLCCVFLNKTFDPGGYLSLSRGYMHVVVHYLKDHSSAKLIDCPFKAKFHIEPLWEGSTKVGINGHGHMTKML